MCDLNHLVKMKRNESNQGVFKTEITQWRNEWALTTRAIMAVFRWMFPWKTYKNPVEQIEINFKWNHTRIQSKIVLKAEVTAHVKKANKLVNNNNRNLSHCWSGSSNEVILLHLSLDVPQYLRYERNKSNLS